MPLNFDTTKRIHWRSSNQVATLTDVATWYLSTCQGRRKSANTIRAYANAIRSIATHLHTNTGVPHHTDLPLDVLNPNDLTDAFNDYAANHAATSQRQASTVWTQMCQLLVDHDILDRNPMTNVASAPGRTGSTIPKALPPEAVRSLLGYLATPDDPTEAHQRRRWQQRDHAIILLLLTTGIREQELCNLNFNDFASTSDTTGAKSLTVRGKGGKERLLVIEKQVVDVISDYLASRIQRHPDTATTSSADPWKAWPPTAPLFVTTDGERITPRTVYSRVERAYREAGINGYRVEGALVHQLRHTVATMMADNPNITVFQLQRILGHSSLAATEKYTLGAGRQVREAARHNPIYGMLD